MKKYFLFLFLGSFPFIGISQEDFYSQSEGIYIELPEAPPSLSRLSPLVPSMHFNLTEPDIFGKNEKREINMLGLVAREKHLQEMRNEYETPIFRHEKKEGTFQVSDNVQLYSRGSNYDVFTGKLKNPVYQEMQARLYNSVYRSYYGGRNYYYSPFIR